MRIAMNAVVRTAGFALVLALLGPRVADATVIINVLESGGDVVFSYSGAIDLTGLGAPDVSVANDVSTFSPLFGAVLIGNLQSMDGWQGPYSFPAYGTSGNHGVADTASGPGFAVYNDGFGIYDGYVSNTLLSGGMTYNGETFASLGLTAGTYEATLPSDNVILNIGPVVIGVPEPGTLSIVLGFGLLGLGAMRWRMRKRSCGADLQRCDMDRA
jgi:hypothetical protein